MVNDKVVIAAAAVAVILSVAISFAISSHYIGELNGSGNAYYEYSFDTCTSFETNGGETETAPEGQMFVVAEMQIKNVDYKWVGMGIMDYPAYFSLEADGETISADFFRTISYQEHYTLTMYDAGEQGETVFLYMVAEGIDLTDAHIVYTGYGNVTHDPAQFRS